MSFAYKPNLSKPATKLKWSMRFANSPIIIDNGNFECRAGYAACENPHLIFPNVVYRPRMSKGVLVGNDIPDLESVRHYLKSPFIENLVSNLDVQEHVFDYIFNRLDVPEKFSNAIVISEPFCNPGVCRSQLSELLFETYSVPKIAYFVDGLASYFENCIGQSKLGPDTDCLIVSIGYQRTHLIPILMNPAIEKDSFGSRLGQPVFHAARRLHTGGIHACWMVQRLLQLKYPCHSERITAGLAQQLVHDYSQLVTNYRDEMNKWKDRKYCQSHTVRVQLPFNQPSNEDLKALADRKRAQTERLLNVHRKRQQNQLESATQRLNDLLEAEDLFNQGDSALQKQYLSNLGLSGTEQIVHEINICRKTISRLEAQLNSHKVGSSQKVLNSDDSSVPAASLEMDSECGMDEDECVVNKFSYGALLEQNLTTNSFGTVPAELNGRHKRAAELLVSQHLPSAIQAQMTVASNPADLKFTETRLRTRVKLAQDLEAGKGDDLALWVNSLRDRRQFVAKRRVQRQSRVDLATQIGLHANDQIGNGSNLNDISSSKCSGQALSSVGSGRIGSSNNASNSREDDGIYGDPKRALTERRRMQLEKIRAMAAELKPSRGRARGDGRGTSKLLRARGTLKTRGRGRGFRSDSSSRSTFPDVYNEPESTDLPNDDSTDLLGVEDSIDGETSINTGGSNTGLTRLWDPDTEDNLNEDSNSITSTNNTTNTSNTKATATITDYKTDPGDESENERDQLSVLDSLLALYDPESHKDLGVSDLKMDLNQFYEIHVDTELVRAPEVLFEPSFIGSTEAGLGDCLDFVLRDTKIHGREMCGSDYDLSFWPKCVFLTGGPASLNGIVERIRSEIRPLLPFGPEFDQIEVIVAANPQLDAWHGARRWACSTLADCEDCYVTIHSYEECGPHYLAEHRLSNSSWLPVITRT